MVVLWKALISTGCDAQDLESGANYFCIAGLCERRRVKLSNMLFSSEGSFLLELENFYLKQPYERSRGHCHHRLEISCIKSGEGIYFVDNDSYDIKQGDVFIFNNIEHHDIDLGGCRELVNMVVHFEPQFIWTHGGNMFDSRYLQIFFDRSENFSNRLDRNNPVTRDIYRLLLEIEEEFLQRPPGFELMVKVKLLNILVYLIRSYGYVRESQKNPGKLREDLKCINRVLEHIENHMGEGLSLGELANIAHMNPCYFSTFFKKYNGIGPSAYISRKRVYRAMEYLRTTNKSILEIATLCGFNNSANFNKTFKKITGIVPSEYR